MGLYIGGTGSANHMQDYEIGSWDCAPTASNPSWVNKEGTYIKVGNLVHCDMWLRAGGTSSSSSQMICTLPFTVTNDGSTAIRPTTAVGRAYNLRNWNGNTVPFAWASANSTSLNFMWNNGGSNPGSLSMNIWQSSAEIHASFTYRCNT